MQYVFGIFFLGLGIEDMLYKKVSLGAVYFTIIIGIVCGLKNSSFIEVLIGAVPGIIFLVLSLVLSNMIGIGDGMLLLAYGCYYGWWKACLCLFMSLSLAAAVGMMWGLMRQRRHVTLPFVPFLALSHLGVCIWV